MLYSLYYCPTGIPWCPHHDLISHSVTLPRCWATPTFAQSQYWWVLGKLIDKFQSHESAWLNSSRENVPTVRKGIDDQVTTWKCDSLPFWKGDDCPIHVVKPYARLVLFSIKHAWFVKNMMQPKQLCKMIFYFLFFINVLANSMVISGQILTCDSGHLGWLNRAAPLGIWALSIMTVTSLPYPNNGEH